MTTQFHPRDKVWYQQDPGWSRPTPARVIRYEPPHYRCTFYWSDGRSTYGLAHPHQLTRRKET